MLSEVYAKKMLDCIIIRRQCYTHPESGWTLDKHPRYKCHHLLFSSEGRQIPQYNTFYTERVYSRVLILILVD